MATAGRAPDVTSGALRRLEAYWAAAERGERGEGSGVYILVRGSDESSVTAEFDAVGGFWTMRVQRVSRARANRDGSGVHAVARVSTLNPPDVVLARLDERP